MLNPPIWLVALVAAALGAAGAGGLARNHYRAEIADIHTAQAEGEAAAERFAREWLTDAHAHGDRLSADLARAESALNQKTMEVDRALRRLTTGRPCLDGPAVQLLNRTYTLATAPAVPSAASTSDAAGGAVATDTAVGEWINLAWSRFETCRTRLDKLIDYREGETQ